MKRIRLVITTITIISSLSCEKDKGPYIVEFEETIQDDTTTVTTPVPPTVFSYTISYNNDIKVMLKDNCVQSCHSMNHPKLDLRPPVSYDQLLTDGMSAPYVNVANPDQSSLYLHLAGVYTLMPKDGPALSQGKIDTIYTWISQGALNN